MIMKKSETAKHDKTQRETRMRDIIKKAAFLLMAEKGLDKVSMREIAEKVHVTKPVLYYYFKNKEDLCASIIEDHEKAFCSQLANVKQYAKGPEDVLYEGLKLHFDFFMKDPIHSKFVIQMISYTLDVSPRMPVERPKNRYIHGMLEQLLQQEAKRGHIPADAIGDVVRLISGVATEIMMSAYLDQHVCPRHSKSALYTPEVIARLVKIVLLGIKEYYKEQK